MAVDTINIDEEEARVDEALAKAKADKTQQLLAEQEKKILSLMAEQGFSEADARKALNGAMSKGRTNEAIADTSYYGDPTASEKALENQSNFRMPKKETGERSPYSPIKQSEIDKINQHEEPESAGVKYHAPRNWNDPSKKNEDGKNYPFRNDLNQNQTETEKSNEWFDTMNPKVNGALKAIADKDPELLQHPAIKELYDQARVGRNLQMAYATVAPWTHDPKLTLEQANAFRLYSDKNLTDAAENLEKLRQRQYEATKSMADDLTNQKSVAGSMHNAVLGLEGNIAQVAIPAVEGANQLRFQSKQVHEIGDNEMNKSITKAQNFWERAKSMGLPDDKAAELAKASPTLNAANIEAFIDTARSYSTSINKEMRDSYNAALNDIASGVAAYQRAMIEARKLNEQSKYNDRKAQGFMRAASNIGASYKIPEWYNESVHSVMQSPPNNKPNDEEPKDNPEGNSGEMDETDIPAAKGQTPPSTPKPAPSKPAPPKPTKIDPWNPDTMNGLNDQQLVNNMIAIGAAYGTSGSKGAKVHIWATTKGAEGNDVVGEKDVVIENAKEQAEGAVSILRRIHAQDEKRGVNILKSILNTNPSAFDALIKAAPDGDGFKNLMTTMRNVSYNTGNEALERQYAAMRPLLIELGYV